tara:strand:+ start:279 stop:506 length:228 start_codon:yes stop_codon:yes gene_type:complete
LRRFSTSQLFSSKEKEEEDQVILWLLPLKERLRLKLLLLERRYRTDRPGRLKMAVPELSPEQARVMPIVLALQGR